MKYCVLCKTQLSDSEKPEHILLDALGGRKTTRDVLCSVCNNTMGAGPDKDLAESVAPLRTIASLKSGSRKKAPSLSVSPAFGESYVLSPDGTPNPKIGKAIDLSEDAAGNKTLSINARDRDQLEHLLGAAAKALKLPDELHDASKNKVRREATLKRTPAGKFSGKLPLGSGRSQEAMAKACLVLWAELVGNAEVCSDRYDEIRAFIRHSKAPNSDTFTFGTDTREMPKLPERFGGNANLIWVGSDSEGTVRGYFRLFGAVGWTFTLCETSTFENLSIVLISNPLDQSQWVCGSEHASVLNFDWVGNRPLYQDIDWAAPRAKFELIMAHSYQKMLDRSLLKIVEDTYLEFGIVKGGSVPDEKIGAFSKRLTHKFMHMVMKEPYEERLQNCQNDCANFDENGQ